MKCPSCKYRNPDQMAFCGKYGKKLEKLCPDCGFLNLMDQVYEILIHKVHDYEGTVNEMNGDGVMALFRSPILACGPRTARAA
jgi:hypothetical protein